MKTVAKNFMVYAKGDIEENDITIECSDEKDMNHYAQACREQGYKEVTTSGVQQQEIDKLNDTLKGSYIVAQTAQGEIKRLQQWVNDLQSGMYINCVYCGHRYGPERDTPVSMADILKEHIEQCPKHPMSALKQENQQLKHGKYGVEYYRQEIEQLQAQNGAMKVDIRLLEMYKSALDCITEGYKCPQIPYMSKNQFCHMSEIARKAINYNGKNDYRDYHNPADVEALEQLQTELKLQYECVGTFARKCEQQVEALAKARESLENSLIILQSVLSPNYTASFVGTVIDSTISKLDEALTAIDKAGGGEK